MRNPAAQGRRDANHSEIAAQYEELFCSVLDLSHVGFGCPDLAIAAAGRMELVEIKSEDGHIKPAQLTFASTWRGPKIVIVRSKADAVNHVLNLRERVSRGRV